MYEAEDAKLHIFPSHFSLFLITYSLLRNLQIHFYEKKNTPNFHAAPASNALFANVGTGRGETDHRQGGR